MLASILTLPFACAILLIAQSGLTPLLSGFWILLACVAGHYFLNRYALLASQNSICLVETLGSDLFIRERSGRRIPVSLAQAAIIHPWLCLITFNCEAEEHVADLPEAKPARNLFSTFNKLKEQFIRRLSGPTRRHVIICRYNASSLKEYRRLRVVLKFS